MQKTTVQQPKNYYFTRFALSVGALLLSIIALVLSISDKKPTDEIIQNAQEVHDRYDEVHTMLIDILSGLNQTGLNETGLVETGTETTREVFPKNNSVTLANFANQPTQGAGNYEGNSDILRAWLEDNRRHESIDTDATTGTITIVLRKPIGYFTDSNGNKVQQPIIIDSTLKFDGLDDQWRVDTSKAISSSGNKEFTFFVPKMQSSIIIGGFVGTFDGNGIESVTVNW